MIDIRIQAVGKEWQPVHWQQEANAFDRDLAQLLGLWVRKLVALAKAKLTELGAVDTGNLRSSITGQVSRVAGQILGIVGTNVPYAADVEFGTGIYSTWPGAPKQRIVAKNGKALKIPIGNWKSLEAVDDPAVQALAARGKSAVTGFIFRHSIAGMKPRPFLTPLLAQHTPQIERDLVALAKRHGFG